MVALAGNVGSFAIFSPKAQKNRTIIGAVFLLLKLLLTLWYMHQLNRHQLKLYFLPFMLWCRDTIITTPRIKNRRTN